MVKDFIALLLSRKNCQGCLPQRHNLDPSLYDYYRFAYEDFSVNTYEAKSSVRRHLKRETKVNKQFDKTNAKSLLVILRLKIGGETPGGTGRLLHC